MKLRDLNPAIAYSNLTACLAELKLYKKYKQIVMDLSSSGRLEEIGFSVDDAANLYLGINLNPELRMYSETSQESVELKMVSEKMAKYNDFLIKEGLLDSVKMESDRICDDNFYGYILKISFNFKKYDPSAYRRSIIHLAAASALAVGSIGGIAALIIQNK